MPIQDPIAANGHRLRSLNNVLDVLEAIHLHGPELGVTDISRIVGVSKGAVHTILSNLEERQYVRRTGSKHYQLGIKLWELGFSAEKDLGLRKIARPVMQKLTDRTGESTHLSVYDAGDVLYLDKVTSPQAVQAYTAIGGRAPAYCVATGKILLAFQDNEEIARVLAGLQRHTDNTIIDSREMRETLARARQQGYATNAGEWRIDVAGVAAPIIGFSGSVLAAIGISGPIYRLTVTKSEEAVSDVIEAARSISEVLRHSPASFRVQESTNVSLRAGAMDHST